MNLTTTEFVRVCFIAPVASSLAHMMTMQETNFGSYRVFFGYYADGAFAGQRMRLTTGLVAIPQEAPVDFTEVEVQIGLRDKPPTFRQTAKSEDRVALLDYTFENPGEHVIRLSFTHEGRKLVDATFDMAVIVNSFSPPEARTLLDRFLDLFR
jgi:hypothetical protein